MKQHHVYLALLAMILSSCQLLRATQPTSNLATSSNSNPLITRNFIPGPPTPTVSNIFTQIPEGIDTPFIPTKTTTTTPPILYSNTEYGFSFSLPASWKGYFIITDTWQGYTFNGQSEVSLEQGPIITIRHPLWTSENPRQDIPITVFTLAQWNSLQQGDYSVIAGGITTELGRNETYVFALYSHYNVANLPGSDEVKTILEGQPLHTYPATPIAGSTAILARIEDILKFSDQCLRVVNDSGSGSLLIWSENWKVSIQGIKIHIIDEGMVTGLKKEYDFLSGDKIILGGGYGAWDETLVPKSWYQVSQTTCPGPYWEVSGIVDH